MSEQIHVWVVDDDEDYCTLMSEVLSDDFEVVMLSSVASFTQRLEGRLPDIVLMDINLPDASGIELCEEILALDSEVAVVFVSGMNTLDERMKAYGAGGVDFIAKPFELMELLAKVKSVASYQAQKQSLKAAESMSRDMAFQSMSESSQYGCVLQFFRECFLCVDYPSLANAFFSLMEQLNLNTCLEIRVEEVQYFVPQGTSISPIEANIFELLDKKGRLYDFGQRTICNDKHVSFLIKNMPLDDEVLCGRLRDIIAVVVEGLEARVLDIKRQQTLTMVLEGMQSLLEGLSSSIQENDQKFCSALSNVTADIRSSFHILDMTEEQEDFFASLVERNLKEANSAGDAFLRIQGSLNSVMDAVESSVANP